MSRELIFRDVEGTEYQPVRHHNKKTGKSAYRIKPPGASNKTDDCVELETAEELAKAMLIDGMPARVQAISGGPVNYLKFGAQKLVSYELSPSIAKKIGVSSESEASQSQADRIREFIIKNFIFPASERGEKSVQIVSGEVHSAMGLENSLPAVCSVLEGKALAQKAKMELVDRQSPIGSDKPSSTIQYIFRLESNDATKINRHALAQLKRRFLKTHSDFEEGKGFTGQSSYHPQEDNYKRAMIAEVKPLRGSLIGAIPLGANILDVLLSKQSNLLGYFKTNQRLEAIRQKHPDALELAVGKLANSDEKPPEAVETFLEAAWPLLVEDTEGNRPYGESRILATVVQALTRPKKAISVIYRRFHNLGQALLGQSLFGNNPLSAEEYRRILELANQLFAIMRDEWGWRPRDLWDVQGFIWITCSEKLGEANEMADQELLARFDGDNNFRDRRKSWNSVQTRAFCEIAYAVHSVGLDWYHTEIPEIRFGRREISAARAAATIGRLLLTNGAVCFSHSNDDIGLRGEFALDADGADAFSRAINDAKLGIADWVHSRPDRNGYWPDEYVNVLETDADKIESGNMKSAQNLILYGPPGTGKTYSTATEAVLLCDGANAPEAQKSIKERYAELRKKGRIGFVTFHQNFSYEDFVEGLRPMQASDDEGTAKSGFGLEARDGIFKEIAKAAAENRGTAVSDDLPAMDGSRKIFKMSLGRAKVSEDDPIYQNAIDGGYVVLGWGGSVDWSDSKYDSWEEIKKRWRQDFPEAGGNDPNMSQMYTFRANMEEGALVVISDGNLKFRAVGEITGPYQYEPGPDGEYNHRRRVRWLWYSDESRPAERIYRKKLSQVSAYQMDKRHVEWEALEQLISSSGQAVETTGEAEPYVLIIDEINRANVSKVFGELITLVEPDKRLGQDNELTVTLPYSGDDFGVPSNLNIIGTMNTADRSIALLDTALRRRFKFKELAPDPSLLGSKRLGLIEGLDLERLLITINERIEYLVDRDHRIGHAFFMRCNNRNDIDLVMRDNVIPLLQEYFFEDWSRVRSVIGTGFIGTNQLDPPPGIEGDKIPSYYVRWGEGPEGAGFPAGAYETLLNDKQGSENANPDNQD